MFTVFDIKRFALHDGPGIRTTVFLKGCPLRCAWCHNPESQVREPEEYIEKQVVDGKEFSSVRKYGRPITEESLLEEVLKDKVFYDTSGGGVTFSGGEPLQQSEALVPLLVRLGNHSVHRALDTCGHAPLDILQQVVKQCELILFDLKLMHPESHRNFTGVDNRLILQNAEYLMSSGLELIFRVPFIPGVNDSQSEQQAFREYFQEHQGRFSEVHLLPYHRAGSHKYHKLNREYTFKDTEVSSNGAIQQMKEDLECAGIRVSIGG
jgi:pyruvate formate lyase activating enzyme